MADANAWMRAQEPSGWASPDDEDGRRCPSCDAGLQDTREGAHGEESRVKGERCPTPDCPDYMEDD